MSGVVGPSLLRTKIQLPPLRAQHINRDRLMLQLQAGLNPDTRLTLVSAPAGFGKSSCLIEWAHRLRQEGAIVAWYALDERDNDPARFAAYLLGAFRSLNQGFHALPDGSEQVGLQTATEQILNIAAEIDDPVDLLLDDYHLIVEPKIHNAISLMAEYLPLNMRLAIGTRADPPLQLARLRAQGKIVEVRMADLRFSTEEMACWLQSVLGWTPSARVLEQLDVHTEGWAAAVALIMMRQPHADEQAFESQLARYSQSQLHTFDYFMQEVFEQQSNEIRQFLLDTCVLNQLHPHLCSTLTGDSSVPLLLNQIASESLFVIPLSATEPIYRYHHLFEHFLRQYLQMHDQPRYLEKHRLAAQWYAEQGDAIEAVHHGLASEDFDFVAQFIENSAWEMLTSSGEFTTIINWLPHFQEQIFTRYPRLCLYFARALAMLGNVKCAQEYVQLATTILDDDTHEIQKRRTLQAVTFNYQATLAAYRGDIASGRRWINRANVMLHAVDGLDRVRIAHTNGYLWYLAGNVPEARRGYEQGLELAHQIEHDYLVVDAHYYLAQIDLLAGKLQAVMDRCKAVIAQNTSKGHLISELMVPMASVHYQQNRAVEAEAILRDAIALARRNNIPAALLYEHLALAEVLLARGEVQEAEASIAQARAFAQGYHSPMAESLIDASAARISLHAGQLDAAVDWARQYQAMEKGESQQDYENLTLVRVWMAQGNHEKALDLLTVVIHSAEAAGRTRNVLTAEILSALACQASGLVDAARFTLQRALKLAQPHGFVRPFLDMGEPMLRLLRHMSAHDNDSGYAGYLLNIATRCDRQQHPADTLTEREVEVLKHVSDGASNQNVADALVISMGTVKSHIHHIMNKLDAQSRTEAVRKARSLNILPD